MIPTNKSLYRYYYSFPRQLIYEESCGRCGKVFYLPEKIAVEKEEKHDPLNCPYCQAPVFLAGVPCVAHEQIPEENVHDSVSLDESRSETFCLDISPHLMKKGKRSEEGDEEEDLQQGGRP